MALSASLSLSLSMQSQQPRCDGILNSVICTCHILCISIARVCGVPRCRSPAVRLSRLQGPFAVSMGAMKKTMKVAMKATVVITRQGISERRYLGPTVNQRPGRLMCRSRSRVRSCRLVLNPRSQSQSPPKPLKNPLD
jgi:hypothetical protein